jgi:glycosidase
VAGSDTFETCQRFSGVSNPRFKVDRFGDWRESYPTNDQVVADGTYRISFNVRTHQITVTLDPNCTTADTWFFRGTPNQWGITPMNQVDSGDIFKVVVTFAKEDPNPRFKIDHFGDWKENYPVKDYTVPDCARYEISFNQANKQIDPKELEKVTTDPCKPDVNKADFREETIYFLITTRFYNGDLSNDYYNRDRIKDGDPQWRGDFKGLIQQLDYIKDLGFSAIWITSPVENRSGLDYHGYHAYDWTRIDPRLESLGATYQDLINAAHAKGLKIIQDVVINHSSQYGIRGKVWIDHLPIKYYVPQGSQPCQVNNGPYQCNLGDYRSPFREDNDTPVAPDWFKERQTSDPNGVVPLKDPDSCGPDPNSCVSVPKPGYNPTRFFGITDTKKLNPEWYHLDGFIAGGDWESPIPLQRKHIAGDAIDLATEHQNVKDYLNGAIFKYLDMGVDAIRLDTVKHVERGNLLEYVNAWKNHKPGLFVFGENLVKGTGLGDLANDNGPSEIRPWWYTRLGNDPRDPNSGGNSGFAVLDFPLFSTFRDNVSRGRYDGIGAMLGWDWIYGDATKLVTFLQNHDVGPDNDFKYRFKGDTWMAAAAYNLLWTIRGIPCLYYGEEIEFMKGAPQDIDGDKMTIDQTGRAYFGDHLQPDQISQTQNHPLYKHIQRLNLIRRNIPALQKAPMSQVNEFGSGMSFVRDYNNGQSYAVVGLASGGDQHITVGNVRNGTYTDAITGNTVNVANGVLSFDVKGNSAGIYVLNGRGKIGQDGPFLR